jgi:hypothetical protein
VIVLHSGKNLLLKQDGDTLILDTKLGGKLTESQVSQIDDLMSPADEDSWFGEASKREEVVALVKQIERDLPWTSRAEESRANQQRIGGR